MNRVKYTALIDSYVDREMNAEERIRFETDLLTNRDLAMEFKLEQDLNEILGDEEIVDFRYKCLEAQNDFNLSTKPFVRLVQITRRYWYAAASVILIALVISGLVIFNPGSYSSEKLFKMYYKSGETIGLSRSGNANMVEALLFFSRNEFGSADIMFDEILLKDPNNFAVMYYSGISNIELKNYQKASHMFESILADGNNLYIEYAQWYLGLTCLVNGQSEQAQNIFVKIASNPQHYYAKDASSILEKISKGEKSKKFLNNLFFLILPF